MDDCGSHFKMESTEVLQTFFVDIGCALHGNISVCYAAWETCPSGACDGDVILVGIQTCLSGKQGMAAADSEQYMSVCPYGMAI